MLVSRVGTLPDKTITIHLVPSSSHDGQYYDLILATYWDLVGKNVIIREEKHVEYGA